MKPVYPLLFFYSIIDGKFSINNYTASSLFDLQVNIKPVNPSLSFYYMINGNFYISSYTISILLSQQA